MGRSDIHVPWEQTDKVDTLKTQAMNEYSLA